MQSLKRLPEEITRAFQSKSKAGQELYSITIHLDYVPGLYRKGVWDLSSVTERLNVLWETMQNRMYVNKKTKDDLMLVSWDVSSTNAKGLGLHCHCLVSVNADKLRGKYEGDFKKFWKQEHTKLFGVTRDGKRDVLKSGVLLSWDGNETFVSYILKSLDGNYGLGVGDLLYFGKF